MLENDPIEFDPTEDPTEGQLPPTEFPEDEDEAVLPNQLPVDLGAASK